MATTILDQVFEEEGSRCEVVGLLNETSALADGMWTPVEYANDIDLKPCLPEIC